jgi:hypothetical protein
MKEVKEISTGDFYTRNSGSYSDRAKRTSTGDFYAVTSSSFNERGKRNFNWRF